MSESDILKTLLQINDALDHDLSNDMIKEIMDAIFNNPLKEDRKKSREDIKKIIEKWRSI